MYASRWRVLRKIPRKLGPVWVVTRYKDGEKQKGYFKFPTRKNKKRVGPLLANELISYHLAKMLNLNAAKIKLTKIQGKQGVVSIVQPAPYHYTWNQLSKRLGNSIIEHIDDPRQLLKTFVFDIWICNVDRHDENLIAFPVEDKYSFYLIDHGLALLGALKWRGVPWDSPYWDYVAAYNKHYVRGLRSYIYSYEQLSPFVEEIQIISKYEITKIVESVPISVLSDNEKDIILKILLYRQNHLHLIVKQWIKEHIENLLDNLKK